MKEVVVNIVTQGSKEAIKDIDNLADSTGFLGTSFKTLKNGLTSALTGIKSLTLGFHGLKAAIISTGIGALVVALGSLIAFFTSTKKGADLLEKATAALGVTFNVIKDRVSQIGEFLVNLFKNPQESLKELGNNIKSFLIDRFQLLIGSIKGFGTAIKLLFEGEFKEAAEVAGKSILDLNRAVNPLVIVGEKLVDVIGDISKEIEKEASAAIKLEGALQKLEDREISNIVVSARRKKEISELRSIAEDDTLSTEKRIEALERASEIQKQITNEEISQAQERARIFGEKLALGESTDEQERELENLKAVVFEKETERFNIEKALIARRRALKSEQEAEEKRQLEEKNEREKLEIEKQQQKLIDDFNRQQELDNLEIQRQDLLLQNEEQRFQEKKQLEEQRFQEELQNLQFKLDTKQLTEEQFRGNKELLEIKHNQNLSKIEKSKLDFDTKIAEARIQSAISTVGSLQQIVKGFSDMGVKTAGLQKVVALAEILTNSAVGMAKAIKAGAGVPFPGNIPAILAGVAAVVSGIAGAQKVLSQAKVPGESLSIPKLEKPNISVSTPNFESKIPERLKTEIQNRIGTSGSFFGQLNKPAGSTRINESSVLCPGSLFSTEGDEVFGGGSGLRQQTIKAVVSEREITSTQERLQKFQERSEIG